MDTINNNSVEQPFSMYGSPQDIYAETAFYRQFSKHIHHHNYYQCMVITRGSCVHCMEDRRTVLQVHDAFILPPWIPHLMEQPSANLEFYQLAIKEAYFQELIRSQRLLGSHHINAIMKHGAIQDRLSFHISLPPVDYRSVLSLMDCLKLELSLSDNINVNIIENVASSILLIFNRVLMNIEDLRSKEHNPPPGYSIDNIERIMQFIDLNYSKPLSAEALAKQSSMSRSNFFETFYRVTGKSPHSYVTNKRITAAKQLLLDTYMTEAEIASCVGFRDFSTFHRNFVSICKCTPGQFRSRTKANASFEL